MPAAPVGRASHETRRCRFSRQVGRHGMSPVIDARGRRGVAAMLIPSRIATVRVPATGPKLTQDRYSVMSQRSVSHAHMQDGQIDPAARRSEMPNSRVWARPVKQHGTRNRAPADSSAERGRDQRAEGMMATGTQIGGAFDRDLEVPPDRGC